LPTERLVVRSQVVAWLLLAGVAGSAALAAEPPASAPDEQPGITIEMLDALTRLPGDLGPLPAVPVPADNPQSEEKIELGRMLFFDKGLSLDRAQSCASCHDPELAFGDGRVRAQGFKGKELPRHSPSILNAAYNPVQFWDGRASTLEQQAEGPLLAAAEMSMLSEGRLVRRVQAVPEYRQRFRAVFGEGPTLKNVTRAIAAFERTLVTPHGRFDRYLRGDKGALSDGEKRGLILFIGKAACSQCHKGPNLTDNRFHRLGLAAGRGPRDVGRLAVTGKESDRGSFKTPTLRNCVLTAPYMHDGSLPTLSDVIDFYDRGGDVARGKSPLIKRLDLSAQEKADLLAFLQSLTGPLPSPQGQVTERTE
jgi:cytochrome c peroxidase